MKIIFFDVETTGLPLSWKEKYTNKSNWPYIVQLAYIISYEDNEISEEQDYILKPEGFKIPEKSTNIHGISNELAIKKGNSRKEILHLFAAQIRSCDYVVAHNADFDINVLRCEFLRNSIADPFKEGLNVICTMKKSKDFCKLPSSYGDYKWPSLQELYIKLFNKSFKDAHNAKFDVKATFECFWKLKRLDILKQLKNPETQKEKYEKLILKIKNKNPELINDLISRFYPLNSGQINPYYINYELIERNSNLKLNGELIDKLYNHLDFRVLSRRNDVILSINLIKKYKTRWDWDALLSTAFPWCQKWDSEFKDEIKDFFWNTEYSKIIASSTKYNWSISLIERFKSYLSWQRLSDNPSLPWSEELIEKYKDKWDWFNLSRNNAIPWNENFINKYHKFWGNRNILQNPPTYLSKTTKYFKYFSSHPKLNWTSVLIDKYINHWDWDQLSGNPNLPWSSELINEFLSYWNFEKISENEFLPWSQELIEEFESQLDFKTLSANQSLPWSETLIVRFIDYWDWKELTIHTGWHLFSDETPYFPLTISTIAKFENYWDWPILSRQSIIKWDLSLLEEFQENWDWVEISKNRDLEWQYNWLLKFNKKLDFGIISKNYKMFWNEKILATFENNLDWELLSTKSNLPWSIDLIEKFEDRWNWNLLICNKSILIDVQFCNRFKGLLNWNDYYFRDNATNFEVLNAYPEKFSSSEKIWNIISPFIDDKFINENFNL